ncbi:GAF domain-containing protein [Thiovibrio sp. JS02]
MAIPLNRTIQVTALAVAIILAALLGLGVRQYQLYRDHDQVTAQTEKLIFQFAIIREHVSESLLDGPYAEFSMVANEIEELNLNLAAIMRSKQVDDQYKLSFHNTIDLPGLVLLVRKIEAAPEKTENLRQLNREIRSLGERLMLFDRVLVEHAKRQLVGFQNIIIGALAMAVCLVIVLLLFFQRRLIVPLLELVGQVKEVASGRRAGLSIAGRSGEISELAYSFHDLLSAREITAQGLAKFQRVAAAVKRAQLAMSKAKDEESLFKEICRALLVNEDYCLVWIGRPNAAGEDVLPVSADGSTTMTSKECNTCVSLLLTEAEEKGLEYNPAAMALRARKPVVKSDILAEVPKGLLKGTPLAAGYAACAALPIVWQGEIYGVLSVYGVAESGFEEKEVELLEGLAADMGLALYTVHEHRLLAREEKLQERLLAALDVIRITVSPGGEILAANEVFVRLAGRAPERIAGLGLHEFFRPGPAAVADAASLLAMLAAEKKCELLLFAAPTAQWLQCVLLVGREEDGVPLEMILLGYPVLKQEETRCSPDTLRLETIAELADGVSHEIGDLTNGLINYAQVLADEESGRVPGSPQSELLDKIIDGGERIAEMVRKLIFYGQKQEIAGEFLSADVVLEDALLLSGYHLKGDGIQLEVRLAPLPPVVPVHAQDIQQALLGVLNVMRAALNNRFAGRDPRKKIGIESKVVTDNSHGRIYQIGLTDYAAALPLVVLATEQERAPQYSGKAQQALAAKLAFCRRVVEENGGSLSIDGEEGNFTRLMIHLPVKGE